MSIELQAIGHHEFSTAWPHQGRIEAFGYISDKETHPCLLSLDFGAVDASLHVTPEDARAIAALWLQVADQADIANGKSPLIGIDWASRPDQTGAQVRYRGSWPPGDGGDWCLRDSDGLHVSEAEVIRRCEYDSSQAPTPSSLWVRPYTPAECERLPNCAICRDTQTIWDENVAGEGRYAPCPRCCAHEHEAATGQAPLPRTTGAHS